MVTENSGYTYSGRKSDQRPTVKSRIDYFLISETLYDYVSKAKIMEEELATTDHRMIVMSLCFSQFAQGMGYFKKVLKIKEEICMWKLKERLNLRPSTKSKILEIITVEKVNGKELETRHTTQMEVQVQIEHFYNKLYDPRKCKDSLKDKIGRAHV